MKVHISWKFVVAIKNADTSGLSDEDCVALEKWEKEHPNSHYMGVADSSEMRLCEISNKYSDDVHTCVLNNN